MKQVTLDTAECQHSHNLSWAGGWWWSQLCELCCCLLCLCSLSKYGISNELCKYCEQATTVSWSVDKGSSTMDLLTLDNTTFTGDPRYSIVVQNPTNWALVIEQVQARDAGKYICSLETFPKQSLMVYLQVNGELRFILKNRQQASNFKVLSFENQWSI